MIFSDEERMAFLDGSVFAPDRLLDEWVARIKNGERSDEVHGLATFIIKDYCLRQYLNAPQSQVTLNWLVDVLQGIVDDHTDPLDALGLKRRAKHRPHDLQPAINVAWWVRIAQERGYDIGEASDLAAALFVKDRKSIDRYRRQAKKFAVQINLETDWDRYFESFNPPRKLPPVKRKK